MVASATRVRWEPLRSIAFGTVTTSYLPVGGPLANPSRIFKLTNLTDQPMFVSIDGIDDYDVSPANSAYLYDFGSNKADAAGLLEEPQNDQIYVKAISSLPSMGAVYVTTIYASQV